VTITEIDVAAGRVRVTRRLALAVEVYDVAAARPAGEGLLVGVETERSVARAVAAWRRGRPPIWPAVPLRNHGGGRFMLDYGSRTGGTVRIRVEDPQLRWTPRRISVDLWTLAEVEAVDGRPPGVAVPALSRVLRVGLLPGPSYAVSGATGALLSVATPQGTPVPWARVEAFSAIGRVGWGHGDEYGQVTVLASHLEGIPPDEPEMFMVALRPHVRDPAAGAPPGPELPPTDRLHDLVLESAVLPHPPQPRPPLDTDLALGLTVPAGWVTGADQVETLRVGGIRRFDIEVPQ
jgi:hypothetical protein